MSNIVYENTFPRTYSSGAFTRRVVVIAVALVIIGALGFGLFNLLSSLGIAFSGLNTLSTTASINLIAGAMIAALAILMVVLSSQKSDEPSIQQKVTQVPTTKEESTSTPAPMKDEKEETPPPSTNIIENPTSIIVHSTHKSHQPDNQQKLTSDLNVEGEEILASSTTPVAPISPNKSLSSVTAIDDLPDEIIDQIFHFLLLDYLPPLKLVCRRFSGCINETRLRRAQAYGYSKSDPNGVEKYLDGLFYSISFLNQLETLPKDCVIKRKTDIENYCPVDAEATLRNIKEILNNQTKKQEVARQLDLALNKLIQNQECIYALLVLGANPESYLDEEGTTLLIKAIRHNFMEVVEYLIHYKGSLDIQDKNQETALMCAVGCGNIEIVRSLIAHNVNLTLQNSKGQTALTLALHMDRLDLVTLLLHTMKGSITTSDMRATLMWAAEQGHIKVMEFIMEPLLSVENAENIMYTQALVGAALSGHIHIVRFLKEKKIDLNSKSIDGTCALHVAAEYGHLEIVEYLKENNANLDIKDQKGKTALMLSISNNHSEIAKYLIQNRANLHIQTSDGLNALMYAAFHGKLEILKELLSKEVDVNLADTYGNTALMYAIHGRHMEVAEFLIKATPTICVNSGNNGDCFALMQSALMGNVKVVKQLIDKGVDIDFSDSKGKTALMLAIYRGHGEVAEILIKANISSLNARDNKSRSALIYAAKREQIGFTKLLLDNNADANLVDEQGRTALIWAICENHGEVAEVLIKATTTSLNAIDSAGHSALMYAVMRGDGKLVQLLLDNKADANLVDERGRTALIWAICENHEELADVLIKVTTSSLNAIDNDGHSALEYATERGQAKIVKLILDKKSRC